MIKDLIIKELTEIQKVVPSGSYYICGTTDTDRDYFTQDTNEARDYLISKGFTYDLEKDYRGLLDYASFRLGQINVILVHDLKNCELATELCKSLHLTSKKHRLLVFNTIRYGQVSDLPSYEL